MKINRLLYYLINFRSSVGSPVTLKKETFHITYFKFYFALAINWRVIFFFLKLIRIVSSKISMNFPFVVIKNIVDPLLIAVGISW